MAHVGMAYEVMAHIGMAYVAMACNAMAYIVVAVTRHSLQQEWPQLLMAHVTPALLSEPREAEGTHSYGM